MFWENENSVQEIEELAARYRAEGNFVQAKSLYTCLIAMIKKQHGNDSEKLALNFYRLAETYSDEGNYQAAQTYYNRAAQIWRRAHPKDSADVRSHAQSLFRMNDIIKREDEEQEEYENLDSAAG